MNATPAPDQDLALQLLSAPHWYGDPPLTGTFGNGATFTLRLPCMVGLTVARTVTLARTATNGSGAQTLGEVTSPVGLCLGGNETIPIPVQTPATFAGQRLKLTIRTAVAANVNLRVGTSAYLEVTRFLDPTPTPTPTFTPTPTPTPTATPQCPPFCDPNCPPYCT
jgi:hypothetical protein